MQRKFMIASITILMKIVFTDGLLEFWVSDVSHTIGEDWTRQYTKVIRLEAIVD